MKRVLVTTVVAGGVLLYAASPAAAAAKERFRMSGHFSYLEGYSTGCTPEVEGRQVCKDVRLSVGHGPDGPDLVSVEVYESVLQDGEDVGNTSYAYGSEEGDLPFTVTKDLSATLAPTTVLLSSYGEDGPLHRWVTVSTSNTAVGPVSTTRDNFRFTAGNCTYMNKFRASSAQVEGTITFDGVTSPQRGHVDSGDVRSSRRCR